MSYLGVYDSVIRIWSQKTLDEIREIINNYMMLIGTEVLKSHRSTPIWEGRKRNKFKRKILEIESKREYIQKK